MWISKHGYRGWSIEPISDAGSSWWRRNEVKIFVTKMSYWKQSKDHLRSYQSRRERHKTLSVNETCKRGALSMRCMFAVSASGLTHSISAHVTSSSSLTKPQHQSYRSNDPLHSNLMCSRLWYTQSIGDRLIHAAVHLSPSPSLRVAVSSSV